MSRKTLNKKKKLAKANRKNRRIPVFALARTRRRVQSRTAKRSWRTDKLRITDE